MLRSAFVVSVVLVSMALVACGEDADGSGTRGGDDGASSGTGGGSSGSSGTATSGGGGGGGNGTGLSQEPRTGIATYYDATGAGACSFDASPQDLLVVAVGAPIYDDAALCGACVEVTGPTGSTKVRVVDKCPECAADHIDLSREAFAKIARIEDGRVPITFTFVECEIASKLRYRYKEGSSRWWTAIQVLDHRVPLAKLEIQKDGAWVEATRMDYNYFLVEDGAGPQPTGLALRITAVDGQVVTDSLPAFGDEPLDTNVHDGTARFE